MKQLQNKLLLIIWVVSTINILQASVSKKVTTSRGSLNLETNKPSTNIVRRELDPTVTSQLTTKNLAIHDASYSALKQKLAPAKTSSILSTTAQETTSIKSQPSSAGTTNETMSIASQSARNALKKNSSKLKLTTQEAAVIEPQLTLTPEAPTLKRNNSSLSIGTKETTLPLETAAPITSPENQLFIGPKLPTKLQRLSSSQSVVTAEKSFADVGINPEMIEHGVTLKDFINKFSERSQKKYDAIPEKLRTEMETAYVTELIKTEATGRAGGNVLGYNQIPLEKIKLQEPWQMEHPSTNLAKINAGLETLAKLYKNNANFHDKYIPETQTQFMAQPASEALAMLQKTFPHAPKKLLQAIELEFRLENNNRYQKKYLIFDDITQPIKTQAKEITENQQWSQETNSEGNYVSKPTNLQKLYNAAQAIEAVKVKAIQDKQALENPSIRSILEAAPRKMLTDGLQATVLQAGTNILSGAQNTLLLNSGDILQSIADIVAPKNQSSNSATVKTSPELPKNFNAPLIIKKAVEATPKITFQNSSFATYLNFKLKSAAIGLKQSPQKLKTLVRKTINTVCDALLLNKETRSNLQAKGAQEVDIIIKDKKSWFYATGQERSSKFNIWMESLVTSLNSARKKSNPSDIQVMQTDPYSQDPLTPKLNLTYDKKTQTLTGVSVNYDGRTYKIDLTGLKPNEQGEFIIETQLYKKPTAVSMWDSMIHNKTITNTIKSLKKAPVKDTPNVPTNDIMNTAEKLLLVDPKVSDGSLTIKFNKNDNTLTVTTQKSGESISAAPSKEGTITSSKIYKTDSKSGTTEVTQKIELKGSVAVDLFAPEIFIEFNPTLQGKDAVTKVTILHENQLVKVGGTPEHPIYAQTKIEIDPKNNPNEIMYNEDTGTYSITTSRIKENAPKVEGLKKKILSKFSDAKSKEAVARILDSFEQKAQNMSAEAYNSAVNNLDTGYVPVLIKNGVDKALGAEVFKDFQTFLKAPIPAEISKIAIELNPTHHVAATRVIKEMSNQTFEKAEISYPFD